MESYKVPAECTLVLVKPDGVKRNLATEIYNRLERVGLHIVGMKLRIHTTREQLDRHFPSSQEWVHTMGEKCLEGLTALGIQEGVVQSVLGTTDADEIGSQIREWNYEYLMSGVVCVMKVEGIHAIACVRKLIGHTIPYRADPGTIRGDFSTDSELAALEHRACCNIVHASANKDEAEQEIRCWFGE